MSSETLHAPRPRLTIHTLTQHQAIASLMEELDAIDWYRQRADDCEDTALKEIILHNMREEMEHACMLLEWLRRNAPDWADRMSTYLFTEAPITEIEEAETAANSDTSVRKEPGTRKARDRVGCTFTVGTLKEHGS